MKKHIPIGSIGGVLSRPVIIIAIAVQFALLMAYAMDRHARTTSEGCLFCHADRTRMTAAGYPELYASQADVEKQSRMPGVKCIDCHLGDGRTHDARKAHLGMPRPMLLDQNLELVARKGRMDSLIPTGDDRMYSLFPKIDDGSGPQPDPGIFTILWHDRDPITLGFDPAIAKKTCGKTGCHPLESQQFNKTDMAGNVRQRSMRHWTDLHGPNNCGPSFADLPPEAGAATGYSPSNYKLIADNMSCPSEYKNATGRQRYCNVCHVGCLDCHYNPTREGGAHNFTKRIPSTTCTGGGRGTGMCHSGSQERRRGDSYLGAEFSQPPGMQTDAHVARNIECMDCHETGEVGMGDMQRSVDCSGCHYSIVKAHDLGVHKKLRCQACHVTRLGGYETTVWGRGHVGQDEDSPFKKYSLYYGVMDSPILVKDQEGMYTPYKIWPNMAINIKRPEAKRGGITFRWPKGETKDAFAMLGTYTSVPGVGNTLVWLQLESVGHPLSRSRSCASCHDSTVQRSKASWEYMNQVGAEPFTGQQYVVADKDGLRVTDVKLTSPMKLTGDARVQDFAAWMFLKDKFDTPGDFSVPKADAGRYKAYVKRQAEFEARLAGEKKRLGSMDKASGEYARLSRLIGRAQAEGAHGPDSGLGVFGR